MKLGTVTPFTLEHYAEDCCLNDLTKYSGSASMRAEMQVLKKSGLGLTLTSSIGTTFSVVKVQDLDWHTKAFSTLKAVHFFALKKKEECIQRDLRD